MRAGAVRKNGSGSNIGTQNKILVNGHMHESLWSNSWWFNFDAYSNEAQSGPWGIGAYSGGLHGP